MMDNVPFSFLEMNKVFWFSWEDKCTLRALDRKMHM